MKTLRKIKRNGSVLALAICILAILIVLGVGFLSLGLDSRLTAIRDASVIVARSTADAGLTEAMVAMTEKLSNIDAIGETSGTLPGFAANPANYTYETEAAYNFVSSGFTRWYCRAESTGYYNQAARQVVARLVLRGLAWRPLQVEDTILLANDTTTGAPFSTDVIMATNSTKPGAISVTSATVNGDTLVGVDGNPADVIKDPGGNSTFNGGKFTASEPYVWTSVLDIMNDTTGLSSLSSSGQKYLANGATDTIGTFGLLTERRYDYIDLDVNSVLTIQGNVNLWLKPSNPQTRNAFNIGNGAQLQLAPNSSLNIFLDGNLNVDNSGPINGYDKNVLPPNPLIPMSANATKLHLYGFPTCQTIDLRVNGQFYGAIYSPNAAVEMKNGFPFIGAIQAYSFTAKNGGTFAFDSRLAEVSPPSPGARFVIDRWWEGAVGETPPDIMP